MTAIAFSHKDFKDSHHPNGFFKKARSFVSNLKHVLGDNVHDGYDNMKEFLAPFRQQKLSLQKQNSITIVESFQEDTHGEHEQKSNLYERIIIRHDSLLSTDVSDESNSSVIQIGNETFEQTSPESANIPEIKSQNDIL